MTQTIQPFNNCLYSGGFLTIIFRHHVLLVALSTALVLSFTGAGFAQVEQKLSAKQLPAAVQAAFQKAYPAAKIKGASSEVENGKTIYEVESVDGKINRNLQYSEDGTVVEIEETIALKTLPAEVSSALKTETGKGKVQKAEKLMKAGTIQYEFVITSGKNTREVVIDSSGRTLKTTKLNAKKKEEVEKD
jgi:hypothetical protein